MATKGILERVKRGIRTLLFMVTMTASLLTSSAPVLVAIADVAVSLGLASRFTCRGWKEHVNRSGLRRSLMDIPLVSIVRSVIVTCVYWLCDGPGLSQGPYLTTVTVCSIASIVVLAVKACLFMPATYIESEASLSLERLHLKRSCRLSVLFLSSLVFALGHIMVAHRASFRARRKLFFHHIDPESVLSCKNIFSGFPKIPHSPTPCSGKNTKSDVGMNRNASVPNERDLPVSLLADADSLFIGCQGLTVHYKLNLSESPAPHSLDSSSAIHELSLSCSPPCISSARHQPKSHYQHNRSFCYQFQNSSLYAPLLAYSPVLSTFSSGEIPVPNLDLGDAYVSMGSNVAEMGKFAVVLVHGFGGGVFSWRHVMGALAWHLGCTVVAFDRPGWGLTSRLCRKDWEERRLPNPYKLESQVDLLISFCLSMGFASVVFVGHDDGGLLALKTAEKLYSSTEPVLVEVKGIVLIGVSLSREVVPAFARILLHTSLGKKHMVRPLLRTEITQVINRRAWYDPTKLTHEVLNMYKAPLCVEGWDEALHEIGRLSCATVLSPQNAEALLKSVEGVPVLVVAGAEDALVPLKSTQAMASKLVNSRLVAISGCGHLPHEERPKALLAALLPFITRLISSPGALQKQ